MFKPIYFFGWIIQPTDYLGSCVAYERTDTSRPNDITFNSILEARKYIKERNKKVC